MDTFIFILLILILGGLCYLLFKSLKKTKSQIIDDEAKINVLQNEKGELEGNRNELKSKISSLNGHIQKLNEYVEQINHHYSSLKKYEPIKNIESEVEKRWYEYLAKENEAKDSLEREINAQKRQNGLVEILSTRR